MKNTAEGVVLFLVDGMRPDGMAQAHTPFMDELAASGAYTLDAQTVSPSITLPCIASLFLSSPPEVHQVTTNTWNPEAPGPGLIDLIHATGGRAASFYNWEPLRDLSRPGSLEAGFFVDNCEEPEGRGDLQLAELAAEYLSREPVDFAFIYLGYTDVAGHREGWMSPAYLAGIENADVCIEKVLAALSGTWGVVVVSDHGGHAGGHGTPCEEDMTIPLILKGFDAWSSGSRLGSGIRIIDIAPTVARWLGIAPPATWQGRAIVP
jgi:predicted AlkP superfamily pyrophosphatase or phosphodiesterase